MLKLSLVHQDVASGHQGAWPHQRQRSKAQKIHQRKTKAKGKPGKRGKNEKTEKKENKKTKKEKKETKKKTKKEELEAAFQRPDGKHEDCY